MASIRLTTAQAIIKFLKNQYVHRDGKEIQFFAGMLGIFGHGNVAGIGQALQENPDFPYILVRNEQSGGEFLLRLAPRDLERTAGPTHRDCAPAHPHHVSPLAMCCRSQSSLISSPRPGPSGNCITLLRTTGSFPAAIFSLNPRNSPRTFSILKKF